MTPHRGTDVKKKEVRVNDNAETEKESSFLTSEGYTICLSMELEFLRGGDMRLVIDPIDIYNIDDDDKGNEPLEEWNDSMAYLIEDVGMSSGKRKTVSQKDDKKPLLKCGFVLSGRPKKVWALQLPGGFIAEDDKNIKWLQVKDELLLTRRSDLLRYRKKVQCALEFGHNEKNTSEHGIWAEQ